MKFRRKRTTDEWKEQIFKTELHMILSKDPVCYGEICLKVTTCLFKKYSWDDSINLLEYGDTSCTQKLDLFGSHACFPYVFSSVQAFPLINKKRQKKEKEEEGTEKEKKRKKKKEKEKKRKKKKRKKEKKKERRLREVEILKNSEERRMAEVVSCLSLPE